MVGGSGVGLDPQSIVRDAELFVAVEVEGGSMRGSELRVRIASAIERAWLPQMFPQAVRTVEAIEWDEAQERVVRRTRERFHDLVLAERTHPDVDRADAGAVLAAAARPDPARAAGVGDAERALLARLRFLQRGMPELDLPPDADAFLADAVVALCDGLRSFAELRRADLLGTLQGRLTRRAAAGPRARGAGALHPAHRAQRRGHLRGRPPARLRRAHPGSLRSARHAAAGGRARGARDPAARSQSAPDADHRRSGELLAHHVPHRAQGTARPLSQARLAGGPLERSADIS